ncbi:MAG: type II secretion system ATPase GspE [Myxococcales bacterium]|nr:type II secretion system ATPase GspE [Myxococcales bacterium]USN49882.1 MAG: type II secretion system ATPase GspE [Myxococcales bacterium]
MSDNNKIKALVRMRADLIGVPLPQIASELFQVPASLVSDAISEAKEKLSSIAEVLVEKRILTSTQVAQLLASHLGLDVIDAIEVDEIPDELLGAIPIAFAKHNRLLPIAITENEQVIVVCCNPLVLEVEEELRITFERDIKWVVSSFEGVLTAINSAYDRSMRQAETAVAELEGEDGGDLKGGLEDEVVDLLDLESDDEAPIIRLVNSLMSQAVKDGASDIHIEPYERELLVRFRVDGVLHEIIRPPKRFQNSIISRVKIMGGLNIAEKRLPQDGRIRLKVAGRDFDIRVSSVPTTHGERIVMRLLDRSSVMRDLAQIGFSDYNLKKMDALIRAAHGILLVTGPTGSGKTSTLYACLAKINRPDLNILTIEDPVEYQLKGIGQVQVNSKIDLSFASGLRSFLRQDPDVIMVGEIRDRETAEIAIQASLTGHLVFSTIHTNDAPGAVTRLVDMQVEPFLVASSLLAVLAQRLVRTICSNCREPYAANEEELNEIGLSLNDVKTLYRGKGCQLCQHTGYRGRLGIFELMEINDDVRAAIMNNNDASTIKTIAREHGMKTLREDGALKVIAGLTTVAEVTRVTREDETSMDAISAA